MLKREVPIFLVVGCSTVLLDFLTYRSLIWFLAIDVETAKAAGFIVGTLFAYFANKLWTFNHKQHAKNAAWRFVLLYTSSLAVNVFVNTGLLNVFSKNVYAIQIAFLAATALSAILNFIGMKWFVFKKTLSMERIK